MVLTVLYFMLYSPWVSGWGLVSRDVKKGNRPDTKKAGRFPIHEIVGPIKNLLPERQKNAQQDTKTQSSCAGIFITHEQKDCFGNLVGLRFLLLK